MQILAIGAAALAAIGAVYLMSLKGRTGVPGQRVLNGHLYAHRGFHQEPDAPENSCEAFRRAVRRGFGAELDVHLLKDGRLAVFHDSLLYRMTGRPGVVEDLTSAQLAEYTLGKSSETIPTLEQVLAIVRGQTPLIIELKTWHRNAAPLCREVCRVLDTYSGPYGIESFDPMVLLWLRRHRPDIVRGQLAENFLHDRAGLGPVLAFLATNMPENVFTRPDFIAYRFQHRKTLSNWLCRRVWHITGASWTLHSPEELATARAEGLWPIFEGFDPEQPQP